MFVGDLAYDISPPNIEEVMFVKKKQKCLHHHS
jgi:hypothetical protein